MRRRRQLKPERVDLDYPLITYWRQQTEDMQKQTERMRLKILWETDAEIEDVLNREDPTHFNIIVALSKFLALYKDDYTKERMRLDLKMILCGTSLSTRSPTNLPSTIFSRSWQALPFKLNTSRQGKKWRCIRLTAKLSSSRTTCRQVARRSTQGPSPNWFTPVYVSVNFCVIQNAIFIIF